MSDEYRPPSRRVLEQARRGIEDVRQGLAETGRAHWHVHALRAWQIYPRTPVLYVVTPRASLVLTRALARALEARTVWLSGIVEAQVLPVDLCASGDPDEPITAVEITMLIRPVRADGLVVPDGVSAIGILVDAGDPGGVWLTLAAERRPLGWPP